MDWMYDGTRVQKDDYLLGKKIDRKYGESTDNGNCLQSCCHQNNIRYMILFLYNIQQFIYYMFLYLTFD